MLGTWVAKTTPPTTISRAASPMARDIARMVPVSIPGRAAGKTCRETACHRVAPSAAWPPARSTPARL